MMWLIWLMACSQDPGAVAPAGGGPVAMPPKGAQLPAGAVTMHTTMSGMGTPAVAEAPGSEPLAGEAITRSCYAPPPPPPPMAAPRPKPSPKSSSNRRPASPRPAPTTGAPPPSMPMAPPTDGLGGLGTRGAGLGGGGTIGDLSGSTATKGLGSGAGGGGLGKSGYGSGPKPELANNKDRGQRGRKKAEDKKRTLVLSEKEAPAADAPVGGAEAGDAGGEWAKPMEQAPVEGWGDVVHLSNDDSMSLASAQRLLWALDQGRHFSAGQVRPHEVLNYFSFDTAPVADNELFSILGGAEQQGDTLSVAFAVQGGMPARQPLDLTLLVDRSGSMSAEGRMAYVKRGLSQLESQLVKGDRVDIVLFDGSPCTPLENYVVGRDDPGLLSKAIDAMQPRGSTNLDAGLREAFGIHNKRPEAERLDRNQRVMLITDAMLNTGNVNEDLVSEVGKQFDANRIRLTGIGVGRDFNDTMLNKLTEKGKGAYVYLGSEAVVDRVFGSGFDSLVQTLAHDVRFSVDLPDSLRMERFYGEESSTVESDIQPIHYYAGTSQLFLQDLKIKPGAVLDDEVVSLKIKWRDAKTDEPAERVFATSVGALLATDSPNVDKAQALMAWTDVLAGYAMGDRRCSQLGTYRKAAAALDGDAEVAYVSGLTGKLCGVDLSKPVLAGVPLKLKLDSDQTIAEVRLSCAGEELRANPNGSVARFDAVSPGQCTVQLHGGVPMTASVTVPETGGDVRCLVRSGRMSCG